MATTFLNPVPTTHIDGVSNTVLNTINFAKLAGQKWVYCNYPEGLSTAALGDKQYGNKYLNRVNVTGDTEVFASYRNNTGLETPIKFGVQLYNPSNDTINVTVKNRGFRTSGPTTGDWNYVVGQTPTDFLNYTATNSFTIGPYLSKWVYNELGPILNGSLFNCYVRFTTDAAVWCFPYAYTSLSNIDGTATLYPWVDNAPNNTHRGYGDTCQLGSWFTLLTSQMPYSYATSSCAYNNGEDIIPINDQGKIWNCDTPGRNLGNWGAHYNFHVTVKNDTNYTYTINGHIGTNSINLTPIIKFNNIVKYTNLNNSANKGRWNWVVETELLPNTSITFNYEYIMGAQSFAPAIHSWTAIRR